MIFFILTNYQSLFKFKCVADKKIEEKIRKKKVTNNREGKFFGQLRTNLSRVFWFVPAWAVARLLVTLEKFSAFVEMKPTNLEQGTTCSAGSTG